MENYIKLQNYRNQIDSALTKGDRFEPFANASFLVVKSKDFALLQRMVALFPDFDLTHTFVKFYEEVKGEM